MTAARISLEVDGDCLLYAGAVTRNGYAALRWQGKWTTGHRLALKLAGVEIPEGAVVHHTCGNRRCMRADHLEVLASQSEHRRLHVRLRKLAASSG